MLNYTIRKLLSMIPMLLIITFLIYLGVELMPGDVIDFLIPMDQLAEMTPEQVDAFKAAKGLDGPMIVRYFSWLKGVCTGDLGYSLQNNMPVGTLMMQKLPATIELSLAALIISTILGILLGVISAIRKGKLADNVLTVAGMIGVCRMSLVNHKTLLIDIEMDAILAVAIGGNSLGGGRFRLTGSVIGAYIIQMLTTTLYAMNVSPVNIKAYKAIVIIVIVVAGSPIVKKWLSHLIKNIKQRSNGAKNGKAVA